MHDDDDQMHTNKRYTEIIKLSDEEPKEKNEKKEEERQ